jgi:hypothetical protein
VEKVYDTEYRGLLSRAAVLEDARDVALKFERQLRHIQQTASDDDTFVIIGDIGYGFQANFPAGNDVKIKVDDLSLAEKDLVKVVGRQFVGMGVVAPKAFVKINKVTE